ncbi:MAG: enoyl-CoA hydratase/isomerase family protein [Chloroflexi bacterium]|nr:enoyl-CoA hydratase/isomerase family protein [Chloroflexota bacterium]
MTVRVERDGTIVTVTIERPAVRNALDPATIDRLIAVFDELGSDPHARAIVLTGAGDTFCAGGDLQWMRDSLVLDDAANHADLQRLAILFERVWRCPRPLIGRVNGVAIGAGAALVACCDLAVAADHSRIGFSEVRIGLVPAIFARFVVPKIGVGHARALFVSGEWITPERAFEIGLVHAVVARSDLDQTVRDLARRCLAGAPGAIATTKRLLDMLAGDDPTAAAATLTTLADVRRGSEAQAGMQAFFARRPPPWIEKG